MDKPSPASPRVRQFVIVVDRIVMAFSRHWLALVNAVLLVYSGLPLLAPLFMHLGWTGPAELIYAGYRLTCHELAYRSFFLFGDQPAYSLGQLVAAFGVPGDDVSYWSGFQGNPELGYKMAWCERDAAIYGTMLLAGLVFGLARARLPRLNWRVYLLLILPMAVDGFWQLFTSPVQFLPFLPVHESTWWLRMLTGILFGAGSVWLIYPHLALAMQDMHDQSQDQLQRAIAHQN